MKTQTSRFTLWLALTITAAPVFAQDTEPAPLPDEWGRIEKAVDLSLDQIQTLRTILDARKAAMADWEKANAATLEDLRQEFKASRDSTNANPAALEARMKPLAAERDAIKNRFEAQMKAVLRPEQKAAWEVSSQHGKTFRQMLETPGLTDDQKTRLTTAFKEFALSLGRWDAAKAADIAALASRGDANSKARHAEPAKAAGQADQIAMLRKEHEEIDAAQSALKAEREKLLDDGATALFEILTPDQRLAAKTMILLKDLESKLRKVNATPEQLAAIQTLCEAEAKTMTGASAKDFIQARNNLQQAILANVLTAEQKNPAPAAPQTAKPAPAAPAPAAP